MEYFRWDEQTQGFFFRRKLSDGSVRHCYTNEPFPNYPFDLNAINPLLPNGVGLDREEAGWYVSMNGVGAAVNKSQAIAACEFLLKYRGLWKETMTVHQQEIIWRNVWNGIGDHGNFLRRFGEAFVAADHANKADLSDVSDLFIERYNLNAPPYTEPKLDEHE